MGLFTRFKDTQEQVDQEQVDQEQVDQEQVDQEQVDQEQVDQEQVDQEQVDQAQLDKTQRALHTALATLDGRLANPGDLPFNAAHLTDESAMQDAITDFLAANPGAKKNYVAGDVGQGNRGSSKNTPDLIELLRMA